MQVFGLPGHVIRSARTMSRLIDAKTPDNAAAVRRDIVSRWRQAMRAGLSAAQAAAAVGVPRSTLYRWRQNPEPKSRRPRRLRQPSWPPGLVEAVEQLRLDNPMWGKRKLAVLLSREGFAASASTVGRILKKLVARGAVIPVPTLRRKPGGRRFCFTNKQRHARRLPRGLKPSRPGQLVQIDTLFINIRPDQPIKHFTAYDPVAKWTVGRVARGATAAAAAALLDKLIAEAPFPIHGIQVDGGSEFKAEFEAAAKAGSSPSTSSHPNGHNSTAPSNATKAHGATSSTKATTSPTASNSSNPSSTPSLTASTMSDPTIPSTCSPQPSISPPSAQANPRSLICSEPGHDLDLDGHSRHVPAFAIGPAPLVKRWPCPFRSASVSQQRGPRAYCNAIGE